MSPSRFVSIAARYLVLGILAAVYKIVWILR